MLQVRFYNQVADELLRFAVIVSKHQEKWAFCKHKERQTHECPGGRRETGEDIFDTAKRELFEETGAIHYVIQPICVYSVQKEGEPESFGMLYYADIAQLGPLPPSEIERIDLLEELPRAWTYPLIQPVLIKKVQEFLRQ